MRTAANHLGDRRVLAVHPREEVVERSNVAREHVRPPRDAHAQQRLAVVVEQRDAPDPVALAHEVVRRLPRVIVERPARGQLEAVEQRFVVGEAKPKHAALAHLGLFIADHLIADDTLATGRVDDERRLDVEALTDRAMQRPPTTHLGFTDAPFDELDAEARGDAPEFDIERWTMQLSRAMEELLHRRVHAVASIAGVVRPELVIEREPVLELVSRIEVLAHAELVEEHDRRLDQRLTDDRTLFVAHTRTDHGDRELRQLILDPSGLDEPRDARAEHQDVAFFGGHAGLRCNGLRRVSPALRVGMCCPPSQDACYKPGS